MEFQSPAIDLGELDLKDLFCFLLQNQKYDLLYKLTGILNNSCPQNNTDFYNDLKNQSLFFELEDYLTENNRLDLIEKLNQIQCNICKKILNINDLECLDFYSNNTTPTSSFSFKKIEYSHESYCYCRYDYDSCSWKGGPCICSTPSKLVFACCENCSHPFMGQNENHVELLINKLKRNF